MLQQDFKFCVYHLPDFFNQMLYLRMVLYLQENCEDGTKRVPTEPLAILLNVPQSASSCNSSDFKPSHFYLVFVIFIFLVLFCFACLPAFNRVDSL